MPDNTIVIALSDIVNECHLLALIANEIRITVDTFIADYNASSASLMLSR